MKHLLKVAVILLLTVNVLFSLSCTSKDLECIRIVEKKVNPCPINGKNYLLMLERGYVQVDAKTYNFYSVNDKFCK